MLEPTTIAIALLTISAIGNAIAARNWRKIAKLRADALEQCQKDFDTLHAQTQRAVQLNAQLAALLNQHHASPYDVLLAPRKPELPN